MPVNLADPFRPPRQELQSEVAERADQPRSDDPDLTKEVRLTGGDLGRQRIAVLRGSALQNIRDEDIRPSHPNRRKHRVEQFSGCTDERNAALVFVVSRGLTDKHHRRRGISAAGHDLRTGL